MPKVGPVLEVHDATPWRRAEVEVRRLHPRQRLGHQHRPNGLVHRRPRPSLRTTDTPAPSSSPAADSRAPMTLQSMQAEVRFRVKGHRTFGRGRHDDRELLMVFRQSKRPRPWTTVVSRGHYGHQNSHRLPPWPRPPRAGPRARVQIHRGPRTRRGRRRRGAPDVGAGGGRPGSTGKATSRTAATTTRGQTEVGWRPAPPMPVRPCPDCGAPTPRKLDIHVRRRPGLVHALRTMRLCLELY